MIIEGKVPKYIFSTLAFYNVIGRAITLYELWQLIPKNQKPFSFHEFLKIISELENKGIIGESRGLLFVRPECSGFGTGEKKINPHTIGLHPWYSGVGINISQIAEIREKQDEILENKWRRLLKYRRVFNCTPFIDFVLVSGSLSLGNVCENSDFDIVIGCEKGRIFTVRFFIILFFSLLGKYRKSTDTKERTKDKFCFSHFITPANYKLQPPYTFYWEEIYRNLVPIYGKEDNVIKFFRINDWLEKGIIIFDNRWFAQKFSFWKGAFEILLFSPAGRIFEKLTKTFQLDRIKRKIPKDVQARIYINDDELEFHPGESRFREVLHKIQSMLF